MKKQRTRRWLKHVHSLAFCVMLIFFVVEPLRAQLLGRYDEAINLSPFPYHIMTYGTQHGLPVNQVEGLARDPQTGVLVLATSNGLHQFNGYAFSRYRTHPFYATTIFVKLLSSHRYEQLLGYNGIGELYHLTEEPELLGNFMAVDITQDYFITIDSLGTIILSTAQEKKERSFKTGIKNATFIHYLNNDAIVISDRSGTYHFYPDSGKLEELLSEPLVDIATTPTRNSHYLLSEQNLYEFSDDRISELEIEISPNHVFRSLIFNDGVLLISASSGLFYWNNTFQITFSDNDILPTNALTTLFQDEQSGTLFIGTSNKGLMKLNQKRVINLITKASDFLGSYGSLVFDNHKIFTIAGRNIVKILSQDQYEVFNTDYKEEYSSSLSLIGDTLFAGTWGNGIFAISKSTGDLFYHNPLGKRVVHATYRDPNGFFWIGTNKGVFTGPSPQNLMPFESDTIKTQITTFYRTRAGEMWMGGQSTVFVLDPSGRIRHRFGPEQGLHANDVRAFHEDEEGKIWIGTYGGGLYCFFKDELISLRSKPNYMLGDDVFTLVKDQYGYILMSSNNGLNVVHQDVLDAYLANRNDYLVPYHVGVQSGVFNTEFNGGFFNNHINVDGKIIYLPTMQGIVFYLSRPIQAKNTNLVFKGAFADGKPVSSARQIARSTKQIRFDFFDIVYSEFDNVYYQYFLGKVGEPVQWSEPSRSTSVQFDFLPPGNYVFYLRSINGSNAAEPDMVEYRFTILPYFYERASVQFGIFLVLMLSMITVLQRRYKRKQALIQKELEIKNTISELELNAIHAQMNPHMIFNSLNVLVHLIRSKSLEKAELFTVDFAQFLRNILERSGDQFVEIQKEVQMLTNYLDIQKIRFNDNFTYEIDCDPQLNAVRIPTMLVQPFVENAVIHGLSHVTQGGLLRLQFRKEGSAVHIHIEDNGIGRQRSAELQAGKRRSSMGLALIEKKMELLRSKHNIQMDLSTTDQDPKNGTGTVVHLVMETKHDRLT